jgi:hypothetical protein
VILPISIWHITTPAPSNINKSPGRRLAPGTPISNTFLIGIVNIIRKTSSLYRTINNAIKTTAMNSGKTMRGPGNISDKKFINHPDVVYYAYKDTALNLQYKLISAHYSNTALGKETR